MNTHLSVGTRVRRKRLYAWGRDYGWHYVRRVEGTRIWVTGCGGPFDAHKFDAEEK